jgi:hypothetical protein
MVRTFAIVTIIIFFCSPALFAQKTKSDTLSLQEGFFGMSYKKGDQKITSEEFKDLLESAPDQSIYTLYSKGENQSTLADVLGFGGGFCVGYGIASQPTNATLAIVGGAIVVVGIILDGNAKAMMTEAVSHYNNSVSSATSRIPEFRIHQQENLLVLSTSF